MKTVDISQAAEILGDGISADHIHARIRRGTISAQRSEDGKWRIDLTELQRIQDQGEYCGNCSQLATGFVIVKYHNHERVEFTLCENCANNAEKAYRKQGGVLEVVSFPLLSEGWLKS